MNEFVRCLLCAGHVYMFYANLNNLALKTALRGYNDSHHFRDEEIKALKHREVEGHAQVHTW